MKKIIILLFFSLTSSGQAIACTHLWGIKQVVKIKKGALVCPNDSYFTLLKVAIAGNNWISAAHVINDLCWSNKSNEKFAVMIYKDISCLGTYHKGWDKINAPALYVRKSDLIQLPESTRPHRR